MISDDDVSNVFYEAANRRIATDFSRVMRSRRLHAPIQAYIEWIRALSVVVNWQPSDDRAKRKDILDRAMIEEFQSLAPDRWQ